jgi:hypothetical protein
MRAAACRALGLQVCDLSRRAVDDQPLMISLQALRAAPHQLCINKPWERLFSSAVHSQQQSSHAHHAYFPVSRGAEVLDGRKVSAQARVLHGCSVSDGVAGANVNMFASCSSTQWVDEVAAEVKEVTQRLKRPPGLAVVLVGSRPDSLLYVTRKKETCVKASACIQLLSQRITGLCSAAEPKVVVVTYMLLV